MIVSPLLAAFVPVIRFRVRACVATAGPLPVSFAERIPKADEEFAPQSVLNRFDCCN